VWPILPAALPRNVIAKLNTSITGLFKQPDEQNSLHTVGTEIAYRTPDEF
jgi:tripartite-type tricarboxylate transporter receptor subunit TctC